MLQALVTGTCCGGLLQERSNVVYASVHSHVSCARKLDYCELYRTRWRHVQAALQDYKSQINPNETSNGTSRLQIAIAVPPSAISMSPLPSRALPLPSYWAPLPSRALPLPLYRPPLPSGALPLPPYWPPLPSGALLCHCHYLRPVLES